jgi:redox-sensitive bicupin YhaK (pirin superfamily)
MIAQTITPVTHDLGGFKVRRVLPGKQRTMVGPFIFVDEFGPARLEPGQAMDVRPHPHINLATVTWLFEGAIDHCDSLGTFATIRPGQVNLMTAGRGIVHSERSPQAELPLIEAGGASARVIMGELWGERAPTTCHAETIYAEIVLQAGAAIPIDAAADERAVMLVGGDAAIDGEALALYALAVLAPGARLTLSSASGGRVMLLGGEAFTSPRHVWWNFVSSSRERINQAKTDWKQGRFATIPGDSDEFIPLPEIPTTVSYP